MIGDVFSGCVLLAIFFVPVAWIKRDYWRDLFAELTHAWRDVTRPLP